MSPIIFPSGPPSGGGGSGGGHGGCVCPQPPQAGPVNTRYGYQASPWDSPLSWGVQAFIEYNGYIINDRLQADRIRVTNITGLDDPDITDSREAIPGDDGEFVYDSWYRGRTFVLTGEIQAGSLGTLMRLERDLRAAFGLLQESPMKFRWFDVYDSFDNPLTLQNYTAQLGASSIHSLAVTGSIVRWATTNEIMLIRTGENRLWGDSQITLRAIVGSVSDTSSIYLVPTYIDVADYLKVSYNAGSGSPTLTITSLNGGVSTLLATAPLSGILQGQSIWLRAKREGDLVTAEVWTNPPVETSLPAFSVSVWLAGSDADLFGDQVLSQVGFGALTPDSDWGLDDFRVESVCPCDVEFDAKKISKLSMNDTQTTMTRFVRSFQITMRASQPYAKCATQSRSSRISLASGGTTQLGFSSPLTNPISARTFVPGSISLENDILFIQNRGTAPDRPIIYVFGAISNFALINLTNGMQLTWSGVLVDGDYLVFDCAKRTLVNSAGTDMLEFLTISDSRWLQLEPDWNDLYLTGVGYSANTSMIVFTRGRWI